MKRYAILSLFALFAVFLAAFTALAQQENPFGASPEVENALRERVDQFYSLFQKGRFREAEQFVVEESRDAYYAARKVRIMGYKIRSLNIEPDLDEAQVMVACEMMVPMASSRPLPVPLTSRWKRIGGEWYLHFEPRKVEDGKWDSPFGPMTFKDDGGHGGTGGAFQNRSQMTLEALQNLYELSAEQVEFATDAAGPVTKTVTVANRAKGSLTLERESPEVKGLDVKVEPAGIERGGEAVISLTYHPKEARLEGEQEIRFLLMPLGQQIKLRVFFR